MKGPLTFRCGIEKQASKHCREGWRRRRKNKEREVTERDLKIIIPAILIHHDLDSGLLMMLTLHVYEEKTTAKSLMDIVIGSVCLF